MAEYKNGVNFRGNMSVEKSNVNADVQTGRAIFVDEDKYENDPVYKAKVDKCLAEGFHRVGSSEGGGEGGGGGTTVEALSVTQNGTYTAPQGKAYSPVAVNVSGGSSDFSTAEVVVRIASNIDASMEGICILNDGDVDYLGTSYPISTGDTSVINAVLYKNEGSVAIQTTGTATVTGNIRRTSPTDYLITGDCTITIRTVS